jgi:uncharacterized tellurite resistance protein B-like protein
MIHRSVMTKLYYLLVHADNKLNEREVAIGRQMMHCEGMSETAFTAQLATLKDRPVSELYGETLSELKKLNIELQIRCIAWMCVVANADGFMDQMEWQFIYRIYHKELNLPLDKIMKVQNELIRLVHQGTS